LPDLTEDERMKAGYPGPMGDIIGKIVMKSTLKILYNTVERSNE
jgi:hypothetical protein